MKSININQHVYVKLNKAGVEHLFTYLDKFNKEYPQLGHKTEDIIKHYQEGEYYKFQLHDFIGIFASTITFGNFMVFEGGELYFKEENTRTIK